MKTLAIYNKSDGTVTEIVKLGNDRDAKLYKQNGPDSVLEIPSVPEKFGGHSWAVKNGKLERSN